MARNGTGTYSVPNIFAAGASITASGHNQNWSDAGAEITNSVAADGQTIMTGPLKAASGTASAPSMAFGADTDTGAYRSGANEFSIAAGGSQVVKVSSAGIDAVSGKVSEGGVNIWDPGDIKLTARSSAPTGWLLCDGSAISRMTYADLFSAIGTTYGPGDGSETFNVPDIGGRVPAGKEATATRLTSAVSGVDGGTLGAAGGSQSHTLVTSEIPNHNHTITDSGHSHHIRSAATANVSGNTSNIIVGGSAGSGTDMGSTDTTTTGISLAAVGGDGAHKNVQPTIIINYIIKI